MEALSLIIEERQRQVSAEGYTPQHDDMYEANELTRAAQCYELHHRDRSYFRRSQFTVPVPKLWPWHASFWKPSPDNRIKELVKAGALYLAESERIKRKIDRIVKEIEAEERKANYAEEKSKPYH